MEDMIYETIKKRFTARFPFVRRKRFNELVDLCRKLTNKYDELCKSDAQKLYGEERIKRERAERDAAILKAKADSLDEMVRITNAWIATVAEVVGEVEIPADKLKANIESGTQPIVTFNHESETYKLKMQGGAE